MFRQRAHLAASLFFAASAAVLTYPWLAHGYLFSADEFMHAYNVCVLDELLFGGDPHGYAAWFALNPWPEPNLFGHSVLLGLTQVVPLYVAEKLLLLCIPVALGYAFLARRDPLRASAAPPAVSAAGWWWRAALGVLALGFACGLVLRHGFLNYLIGMSIALAAATATAGAGRSGRWSISAWALLLYLCHPIPLLLFGGFVALREALHRGLVTEWLAPRAGRWGGFAVDLLRWFGLPLALLVAYHLRHAGDGALGSGSLRRLGGFAIAYGDLVLFDGGEMLGAVGLYALAVACCACGLLALLRTGGSAGTLAVGTLGALVIIVVAVPDVLSGGAYIYQRVRPFVFAWGLFFAAHGATAYGAAGLRYVASRERRLLVAALSVGVAVCVGALTASRAASVAGAAAELGDLRALGERLPAGSAVLPVGAPSTPLSSGDFSSPFHHFAGALGCERGIVLVDNYEAFVGYFPLVWREGRDPFAAMTRGVEARPADIPEGARAYFLAHVDFVLSRGTLERTLSPSTAAWMAECLVPFAEDPRGRYLLYAVVEPTDVVASERLEPATGYMIPRSR